MNRRTIIKFLGLTTLYPYNLAATSKILKGNQGIHINHDKSLLEADIKSIADKYSLISPGELLVLTGRYECLKTSLIDLMALNMSMKQNLKVTYFSLQKSTDEVMRSLLSLHSEVHIDKLIDGNISNNSFSKIITSADEIAKCSIGIDATQGLCTETIMEKTLRVKNKSGVDVVIVNSGNKYNYHLKSQITQLKYFAKLHKIKIFISYPGTTIKPNIFSAHPFKAADIILQSNTQKKIIATEHMCHEKIKLCVYKKNRSYPKSLKWS